MKASNLPPPPSNQWSPTISILIPTLNSAKTLRACLESIAMQDYPKDNIEIIIADGGSTDGTLEIISEFSSAYNLHPQTSNCSFPPPPSNCPFPASNLPPQSVSAPRLLPIIRKSFASLL